MGDSPFPDRYAAQLDLEDYPSPPVSSPQRIWNLGPPRRTRLQRNAIKTEGSKKEGHPAWTDMERRAGANVNAQTAPYLATWGPSMQHASVSKGAQGTRSREVRKHKEQRGHADQANNKVRGLTFRLSGFSGSRRARRGSRVWCRVGGRLCAPGALEHWSAVVQDSDTAAATDPNM